MKYLYFTIYRLLTKAKNHDTPEWSAMLLLSIFQVANIATLSLLFPKYLHSKYATRTEVISEGITVAIVVVVINYFVLIINTDYLREKHQYESDRQKIIGIILLLIYCLGSAFAVYFVSE